VLQLGELGASVALREDGADAVKYLISRPGRTAVSDITTRSTCQAS
jgi:hypothetical protein